MTKAKAKAQLVSLTQARYTAKHGVEVMDRDPRGTEAFDSNWNKEYVWFPYLKVEEITVWCECGYGHYAMEFAGDIVAIGKDVMHGAGYTLVGEAVSQDGRLHVCQDLM